MEVQASFGLYRHSLEKPVEQPAFAAADRAVQVQAARLPVFQLRQLLGHAVDDPALAVTELIATTARLVFEPGQQFAFRGSVGAQALAELTQRGRDPGRQIDSSLVDGSAGRSLRDGRHFDQ